MAFFKKHYNQKNYTNKFKQSKTTIRDKKSWVVTPSMCFNLLESGTRSTFQIIGHRNLRKFRKTTFREARQAWNLVSRTKKKKQRAYFFSKKGVRHYRVKPVKFGKFSKQWPGKLATQQFRLSKKARINVIRRYKRRLNLFKWQGAYMLTVFGASNATILLRSKF